MKISTDQIQEFVNHLSREEKSDATQEKYITPLSCLKSP